MCRDWTLPQVAPPSMRPSLRTLSGRKKHSAASAQRVTRPQKRNRAAAPGRTWPYLSLCGHAGMTICEMAMPVIAAMPPGNARVIHCGADGWWKRRGKNIRERCAAKGRGKKAREAGEGVTGAAGPQARPIAPFDDIGAAANPSGKYTALILPAGCRTSRRSLMLCNFICISRPASWLS